MNEWRKQIIVVVSSLVFSISYRNVWKFFGQNDKLQLVFQTL